MESIIQHEKECFVCGNTRDLAPHHCLMGNGMRPLAEQYGLKVWLCLDHHTGDHGVHHGNEALRKELQRVGERAFLDYYRKTVEDWIEIFGMNFL